MSTPDLSQVVLEALPEPVCLIDRKGVVLAANQPFLNLLAWDEGALPGCSATLFWPELIDGNLGVGERAAELRTLDGVSVSVKLSIAFFNDISVVRVLASFSENEVTKVFHNQRLETLGLLAGGVAHDFNNILTGMLGHLAYLRSILPSTGDHTESLQSIEEGAVRASGMTQQIVNFSRLTPNAASTKIELTDIIGKLCPLMRGAIPSDIQLRWSPPKQPVTLLGTEAHICQIVINLVVNARDAIEGPGTIEVSLSPRCNEDDISQIFGDEPPSEAYAELVVTDTGCGMSEDTKRRLFEPYFTTKNGSGRSTEGRASGGTGLGLATVQSIVRSLGGAIIVESEVGGGSTFRVIVPVVSESPRVTAEDPTVSNTDQPVRGAGERILVIDDEYAVRNVLGLSLTHLGYSLETAASGLEGLEKYAEADGHFDLIILDLLMPGLSGEEVFSRLKRLNSNVKVLIVSGFSSETVVRRLLDNGGTGFIQKPFSIEVLADRVHRCLHE